LNIRTVFLSVLLLQAGAFAQSVGGTIGGTVRDGGRKPISGAAVKLVQRDTNRLRSVVTDRAGRFTVSNLPPGEYRIEAAHTGYRTLLHKISLETGQEVRIEIALTVGQPGETVDVTAAGGLLRMDSSSLGGVIDNRQIVGLPLDGRNFYELTLLLPGVAPPAEGSAGSVLGAFAVNVNGAREDSNNFLLDGVFNNDPKLNGIAVTPPVDAVREMEVATGAYDASFGRNAGGQLSVVLKSGTNSFHGTAYEFFRNGVTDARNFFAPSGESRPQYQRNQFGWSLGGPVVRDRTFFFADYEGTREREGQTLVSNVPTALERSGNFSLSGLPAIDPTTGQPYPNNTIPKNRLDPVGLAIAALYPLPNRSVANQNFVSSPSERNREDQFDARLDHRLTAVDDLSARYSFADSSLYEPFAGATYAVIPGYGTDIPARAQNAMVSETHTFTPNLLNELRLAVDRVAQGDFQQDFGNNVNQAVGLPAISTNPRDFGLSLISITGYSAIGDDPNNPQHSAASTYQLTDSVTCSRGRHLFRAGVELRYTQQNAFRDEEARGFLSFLGLTGNGLSDLLQGMPALTGVATLDNAEHLRANSTYFFAQDSWRARPDLTISAGLRYEYNAPPVDAFNRANVYDAATQSLVQVGTGGIPRGGYLPDTNNWAPRIGLAWRPRQGRTVLRAGYGIYYDQGALATGEGLYFNPPYFNFTVYYPLEQSPLTLSNPFPQNFPIPYPPSALAYQRDLRTPYVQQWNFTIQREVGRNAVAEIGYAGSKGTKLLGARDLNQPFPSADPLNPRPVEQFADIDILESRGNSDYQSLQARFQQRFDHGITAMAAYTWSKSIDDASGFFSSAGDGNFPQNSHDVDAERGLSNFDLRHRFSLSYSYDLPLGKGRWRNGWQTFGIWTFQSGNPFTVALLPDFDNSNTGESILGFGANDRPNVLHNAALANPTPERWFDTSAFAIPPSGSFGNAGRNILTGPGLQNINASLVKNTVLFERATLQFRTEVFNLLNHTNLNLPDNFVGSPTFGQILSAKDPRHIQFGLKLIF
jgi:outer membrane receptor protein involved in Fe transport